MSSRRSTRRGRTPTVLVVGTLVAAGLVAGGVAVAVAGGSGPAPGCGASLRVAAAPAVAPALASAARSLHGADGTCVAVSVESVAPQDVVAELNAGRIRPPDVWVPDSSLWLNRAAVDHLAAVDRAASIASSPLVLAMTRSTADRIGAGAHPRLSDLLATTGAGRPFTLALSDQRLSPGRVGAVVALARATAARDDARVALTGVLRAVRASPSVLTDPLGMLRSRTPVAVPVAEQTLLAAGRPDLVAVRPGTVTFDYPYAVLTSDRAAIDAADQLFGLVRGHRGRIALERAGLRDVSGAAGPETAPPAPLGDPRVRPPRPLTAASLASAERTLAAVNRDARLLALLDVSGSMAWGVAGADTPGPSRLRLATEAARRGMSFYPDGTRVGVWTFPGTRTDEPVRRVAPVASLGTARGRLASALSGIAPVPGGSTPLYAATLGAVREVRRGWDRELVNAVVLLSDGHDTGGGPALADLLGTLRSMRASPRPVPVITIGFGPDSDGSALAAISTASGGAAYRARDAAALRRVFLDALGQRVCRPDCRPTR